jgi:glycerol-3-phosphate dehydrogenase
MPGGDFESFLDGLRRDRPWLPPALARRLARAYGTRVDKLLGSASRLHDLGRDLGAGLTEREVDYLVREEWARSADDILWRRSRLGLRGGPALAARVSDHLAHAGADAVSG